MGSTTGFYIMYTDLLIDEINSPLDLTEIYIIITASTKITDNNQCRVNKNMIHLTRVSNKEGERDLI